MVVAVLMVTVVNMLLLSAAGQLVGSRMHLWRYGAASLAGGIITCLSLVDGFSFLGSFLWQVVLISATGLLAMGLSKEVLKHLLLFLLLRLSVGSVSESENMTSVVLGAVGMGFACLCLRKKSRMIPVELSFRGKTHRIMALYDTGNNLRDPVTGRGVLVVDAHVARQLTGLEPIALQDPVGSLVCFPGLRLIPYQSVGNSGFLLALQIPEAKIGNRKGSILVALSPNLLSQHYQALAGGTL